MYVLLVIGLCMVSACVGFFFGSAMAMNKMAERDEPVGGTDEVVKIGKNTTGD